jgi:hypothetical protein
MAKFGLIAAGIMLGFETLIGCIVALGIGFEPVPLPMGLAFAMGFPVYLLGLRSIRAAAIGLWALFLYRWGVLCCVTRPCQVVSPGWGWASLLPVSAFLVSACIWKLSRAKEPVRVNTLLDIFRHQTAGET